MKLLLLLLLLGFVLSFSLSLFFVFFKGKGNLETEFYPFNLGLILSHGKNKV
jgi:hypothetical protein